MDTVISNKYSDVFNSLDIEVSKRLKGVKSMSTTNPTPKKYAFANILNYLGEDYTYKDTTGKKHTIAKNDTWKADVVTTYTDDAEAWKGDSDSADTVYIGYKHREPTILKKTSGLPAAKDVNSSI